MDETIYRTMRGTGVTNIVLGIVTMVTGMAAKQEDIIWMKKFTEP